MPYNAKYLRKLVEKANAEVEESAQSIYNKYQDEFNSRLLKQLPDGVYLSCGMGSASIDNAKGESLENDLVNLLVELQYPLELQAGFMTPDIDKRTQ